MHLKKLGFVNLILFSSALIMVQKTHSVTSSKDIEKIIPEQSNTSPECIALSRRVLEMDKFEAAKNIPQLMKCLESESYLGNGAAKTALAFIGKPAVPTIVETLNDLNNYKSMDLNDPKTKEAVEQVLKKFPDINREAYLKQIARKEPNAKALGSILTLERMGPDAKEAASTLIKILQIKDTPDEIKLHAVRALGRMGEIKFLLQVVQGQEPNIDPSWGAGGIETADPSVAATTIPTLRKALKRPDGKPNVSVISALGKMGSAASSAVPDLIELYKRSDGYASYAGEALLGIGTEEALKATKSYRIKKGTYRSYLDIRLNAALNSDFNIFTGLVLGVMAFIGIRIRPHRKILCGALFLPAVAWVINALWIVYCIKGGPTGRTDIFLPLITIITLLAIVSWTVGLILPQQNGTGDKNLPNA